MFGYTRPFAARPCLPLLVPWGRLPLVVFSGDGVAIGSARGCLVVFFALVVALLAAYSPGLLARFGLYLPALSWQAIDGRCTLDWCGVGVDVWLPPGSI